MFRRYPVSTFFILAFLCVFVPTAFSTSSSQQHGAGFGKLQTAAAQPVSKWLQDGQSLARSRRAPWDWSLDALKCSLKILSSQVSNYHDNQMMCCGLWWIKAYMKREAKQHCGDSANRSIEVFNEMINENLIYSEFAKSLIGDQNADCAAFPEGSPVCDRFFATIMLIFVMVLLTLITILVGFIVSLVLCIRWRRAYLCELGKRGGKGDSSYKKANSLSDVSNSSSTNNNNNRKPTQRLINMLGSAFNNPKKSRPTVTYNDSLLKRELNERQPPRPRPLHGNAQVANGVDVGRVTPPSDGRSSSASTSSSNVPELHKDDKV